MGLTRTSWEVNRYVDDSGREYYLAVCAYCDWQNRYVFMSSATREVSKHWGRYHRADYESWLRGESSV